MQRLIPPWVRIGPTLIHFAFAEDIDLAHFRRTEEQHSQQGNAYRQGYEMPKSKNRKKTRGQVRALGLSNIRLSSESILFEGSRFTAADLYCIGDHMMKSACNLVSEGGRVSQSMVGFSRDGRNIMLLGSDHSGVRVTRDKYCDSVHLPGSPFENLATVARVVRQLDLIALVGHCESWTLRPGMDPLSVSVNDLVAGQTYDAEIMVQMVSPELGVEVVSVTPIVDTPFGRLASQLDAKLLDRSFNGMADCFPTAPVRMERG